MSWNLRECKAKWASHPWSIDVNLSPMPPQPSIQIYDAANHSVLEIAVTPTEQNLKTEALGKPVGEAYVRQNDLIAYFPESSPWRYGYQIDMRVLPCDLPGTFALEIWLSVQTSLLDSNPQLELQFRGEPFALTEHSCWTSESSRLGVLVHPLDQQDCHVEPITNGLMMRVFGRFMEKGVIRRMRFQLIATSQNQASGYWQERFREFSDSPLPLTA